MTAKNRKKKIEKALKGKYKVMFYKDELGRTRTIQKIDQSNAEKAIAIARGMLDALKEEGIAPASPNAEHVIEVNGQKYQYDPNKVSKTEAQQQLEEFSKIATKLAKLGLEAALV